ncbi:Metallo-dependent hydrolase [Hesseltinella vesiculosa]|uniref:Metallo-dependent hydrolase n=1 Tax=Hesseltinella vesiculosa TaxID=101127 RepID=A0A1X2G3X0_9FUNG|nr:Metallo-dependent hydrolase [Hesseltinella vesiculosa]
MTDLPDAADLFEDLCDGHCHPHDDTMQLTKIAALQTGRVTLMGVRLDDWPTVEALHLANPEKCIPCFGIHPWFVYRLLPGDSSDADRHYEGVLESRDNDERHQLISQLAPPIPWNVWQTTLRRMLIKYPCALVGEVGLDRSARLLPGGAIEWHGVKPTQVTCSIDHQFSILQQQVQLAMELDRAVSLHCVQSQGHVLQLLSWVAKQRPANPLRLCVHSFGGKPQTIPQLVNIKGTAVYMSFSVTINARLGWPKLSKLIQAVPDDRLLIESDVNSPDGLDKAMAQMAVLVAMAKNWSVEEAVQQTRSNWQAFTKIGI